MKQLKLPLAKTWDAINHRPYDDERQRALEGLPHYWKISWGLTDSIVADCGKHMFITRVAWLEDPNQQIVTRCHYQELGLCDAN